MPFYEATQLQAFRPDGGIEPWWWTLYQQRQQYQGQQQTQYEPEQEQILGEVGFPAVIDKNGLVCQGHAASQDTHAYGCETQYEDTPELGSGVPEYNDATTQWQDTHHTQHHAQQLAHDSAHQQQQVQEYYHLDEQPHHEQEYSQQTQSLAQLHAAGHDQYDPAQHTQIQQQYPIQQQQPCTDGNGNEVVQEEFADPTYRARIALWADAILRGEGAGSGSWSSSLIPSSSSSSAASAGSSPMEMNSEMEPPVNMVMDVGIGSEVLFLTPAQELQMQEGYAPQQGQGQCNDYPQQQHQQQGYEQGYTQAYVPEQDVYHAQHLNHSHQQQEQQHLRCEPAHQMALARPEQQYNHKRELIEAEREQLEADRAVQQQQYSHTQNINRHQQEWDRDEDVDEEELAPLPFFVPSQAHLLPTPGPQAHLLPPYRQQHHQHQNGHGHPQQQYQGQRVIDPDAPFMNPLTWDTPPLHASQSLSHLGTNPKSPRNRDTSNSGKGKGKAASSTLGSPIKLGPTASLGSALGTVIPAHRRRRLRRAGSPIGLGHSLDLPGSKMSAGVEGQGGTGDIVAGMGAGDDTGKKEKPPEKKQELACLFCRERKIACGRPEAGSDNPSCNQCERRHICCEYPKESRRGQHKRTRKSRFGHVEGHDVNEGPLMVDTVNFREGVGGGGGKALPNHIPMVHNTH